MKFSRRASRKADELIMKLRSRLQMYDKSMYLRQQAFPEMRAAAKEFLQLCKDDDKLEMLCQEIGVDLKDVEKGLKPGSLPSFKLSLLIAKRYC